MGLSDFTLAMAALGAVLGVINTIWALWRDRVRIRVRPVWLVRRVRVGAELHAISTEFPDGVARNPDGPIGVRVVNLGFTDVTIESVGFSRDGFFARHVPGARAHSPILRNPDAAINVPCRLRARESIVIWGSPEGRELLTSLKRTKRVFAATSCGRIFYANTRLWRRVQKLVRELD